MRSSIVCALVAAAALAAGGNKNPARVDAHVAVPCTTTPGSTVSMRKLPESIGDAAMLVTSPPGDNRLFVVGQRGAIRIYENEVLRPPPFLDLKPEPDGPVAFGGELGLLGLAFHPQYATNGQFFVWYTTHQGGAPGAPRLPARHAPGRRAPDAQPHGA